MKNKYFKALSTFILVACAHQGADFEDISHLTFTNTQEMGLYESRFIEKYKPKIVIDEWENLVPSRTSNKSLQTIEELDYLLELQKIRTKADLRKIERQKKFCRFEMPGYNLGQLNELDNLLFDAFADVSYYIFKQKVKNNRVRPSFLSSKLKPAIRNPSHPSYPSAHAGQSMITALILSEVFPRLKKELLTRAEKIGSNRELAGVHYPSDTQAGQEIAQKFFAMLKLKHRFNEQIKSLRNRNINNSGFNLSECEEFMSNKLSSYR